MSEICPVLDIHQDSAWLKRFQASSGKFLFLLTISVSNWKLFATPQGNAFFLTKLHRICACTLRCWQLEGQWVEGTQHSVWARSSHLVNESRISSSWISNGNQHHGVLMQGYWRYNTRYTTSWTRLDGSYLGNGHRLPCSAWSSKKGSECRHIRKAFACTMCITHV